MNKADKIGVFVIVPFVIAGIGALLTWAEYAVVHHSFENWVQTVHTKTVHTSHLVSSSHHSIEADIFIGGLLGVAYLVIIALGVALIEDEVKKAKKSG